MIGFKKFHQYFIKTIAKMFMSQNRYLQLQWVLDYQDDAVQRYQKTVRGIVNFRFTKEQISTSLIVIFLAIARKMIFNSPKAFGVFISIAFFTMHFPILRYAHMLFASLLSPRTAFSYPFHSNPFEVFSRIREI